jgi:hypothetical protein
MKISMPEKFYHGFQLWEVSSALGTLTPWASGPMVSIVRENRQKTNSAVALPLSSTAALKGNTWSHKILPGKSHFIK